MGKYGFFSQYVLFVVLVSNLSACTLAPPGYDLLGEERVKAFFSVTSNHPAFVELERKWIFSLYFDRGMNYQNSRLEVISFSRLLDNYIATNSFDAILLNCVDDYQGVVSIDDVRRYDLQLAIQIKLAEGSNRPSWLQPLLIVVPDGKNPPFLERFLTANIRELHFVRLADYYAPLDRKVLTRTSAELGRAVFKDNCLFCHSIRGVGGTKGGSLLKKFDFQLTREQHRFRDTFLTKHGQFNKDKQNIKQFLAVNDLKALSVFLLEMTNGKHSRPVKNLSVQ